uniref:Uncharacterized protein n=1 Tax=Solanum tuberosum TaxID=4113 RepID=M1BZI6_SOLTU
MLEVQIVQDMLTPVWRLEETIIAQRQTLINLCSQERICTLSRTSLSLEEDSLSTFSF